MHDAKERQKKENRDDDHGSSGSSGTMIVDAACSPSNIRYPQDVSLLNEARENAEHLLDILHGPADGKKPRTCRECARKDYLKYAKCRKHNIHLSGPALGRPRKNDTRDKAQDYRDDCERVEVERRFTVRLF